VGGGVFAVFEEDRRDARMAFEYADEYADEFGSAIAAISGDSGEGGHRLIIHCYV
jgi:hypothetical protein